MKKLAAIAAIALIVLPVSSADAKPWHDHKHDPPVTYIIDWD